VKLLVDNQLPPALARFIQSEFGCSATHVADVGLRDASDAEVWQYASKTDSILVSKDEDFTTMILEAPTAKLIWVRAGNCRKGYLFELLRHMWPRVLARLASGERLIEIR
jgi:predicted nuclease of predicted toxin-antitoxin system